MVVGLPMLLYWHRQQLSPILYLAIRMGFFIGRNVMRKQQKFRATLLLGVICLMFICPRAFAGSRSASVKISCTILPVLEMSTPTFNSSTRNNLASSGPKDKIELKLTDSMVSVNTNLGNNYQLTESLAKGESIPIHYYSVTAL